MEELLKSLDPALELLDERIEKESIELHVKRNTLKETCPYCGEESGSVHSVHRKRIHDLPVQEKLLTLVLERRIFFCKNPQCKHKTFIEELHFIDGKCARQTKRLDERIRNIALKMSARSAKKVVNSGLTVISDDTILRILKKTESM